MTGLAPLLALASASAAQDGPVVGLWKLDEGQGAEVQDASGRLGPGRIAGAEWVDGRVGGALRFDGSDDHVDLPPSTAYAFTSQDSFTIDLWLRTTHLRFCTPLIARDGPEVSFSFTLGREPGRIALELWSWPQVKLVSRTGVADGEWHHVVGAHDATTGQACLLLDGKLEAIGAAGRGGPEKAQLRLGDNLGAHQPFSGEIDELCITRELPEEVTAALERQAEWVLLGEARVREMQQAYLDRLARPRNPHAANPAQWQARRERVRLHVLDSLGLLPSPEPVPLNVHVAGELDRDGYVVKRLYWQTWPHYYASGYLYLPKGLEGKAPAILNPHGHWAQGSREPRVQARLIGLARRGYVCLAVDSVHAYDYYAGITPISIMTWNNMRGVDVLCSLPEVDPERIGCTGCSGGGQQTFYLMAVENRLRAAVPVCMVSESRRILGADFHHCPCNHVAGLLAETDATEMAACMAPDPSLYICVTGDWTKWFPEEGYPEIRAIYALQDAVGRVDCRQHEWDHDYSQAMREQAYAWFDRWLMGITDAERAREGDVQTESPEALAALDGPPSDARGPEAVFEETRRRRAAPPFTASDRESVAASARRLRTALAETLRQPRADTVPAAEVVDRRSIGECYVVRLLIRTEPDIRVPVVLLTPHGRATELPGVLIADDRGKALLLGERWDDLASIVSRGLCVAVADVRFCGEWALDAPVQRLNGIFLGRPPAAVGSHDLVAVAGWLRSRPEVRDDAVGVMGLGDAGVLALMAAALDPAVTFAAALEVGPTYSEGRTDPVASHLVAVGDLPEIAASCAPRGVWLGAVNEVAPWEVAGQAYAAAGDPSRLRVHKRPSDLGDPAFWAWLTGDFAD